MSSQNSMDITSQDLENILALAHKLPEETADPKENVEIPKEEIKGEKRKIEKYYDERNNRRPPKSKFSWMRNFNNWCKRILINEAFNLKYRQNSETLVLDMACGVGGDLLKYEGFGNVQYTGLDMSSVSIEKAYTRYESLISQNKITSKVNYNVFDMTTPMSIYQQYDIVSCMFAMHYAFENPKSLHTFFHNISEALTPYGIFIGIIPDASVITHRIRRRPGKAPVKNNMYEIRASKKTSSTLRSNGITGAIGLDYDIRLSCNNDVLFETCKEYLAPRPSVMQIASQYGFEILMWENLQSFYWKFSQDEYYRSLFQDTYLHKHRISLDEWEIIHLYTAFIMRKLPP